MRFNRLIITIASIIVMMTVPIFAQTSNILIQIARDAELTKDILDQTGLKICLREDDFYIASIGKSRLSKISDYNIDFEVIDENAWTEDYYLISDGKNLQKGNVLLSFGSGTLVKMDEDAAVELAASGVSMSRMSNRSLPLHTDQPRFVPGKQDYLGVKDIIDDALAKVSEQEYLGYLERLQDFQTRYALSDSTIAVRNWLKNKFIEFGYTDVTFDHFVGPQDSDQANVVAVKPGTSGTDRVIVIGAHYDSIVRDVQMRLIFAPGVDDNGSGTAGTLELARVFADIDLETTLIFVTFAAEELGLWGSEHYAEAAANANMNIDVMLNMDMIATLLDDIRDVNVRTDEQSTAFAELIASLTEEYTTLIPRFANSGSASDHYPFQQFGYPAIFMQEGDFSPVYHSTEDVLDNVTIEYAAEVVKTLVPSIIVLSDAPEVPQDLTALETGDGTSQVLTWTENQDPDIAGYKVYYGFNSGDYLSSKTVTTPIDSLTDLTPNQPVYAAVSAFDTDGNESLLSTEIEFTPNDLPEIPLGLEATSMQDRIVIEWDASNEELDFDGYLLTRVDVDSNTKFFNFGREQTRFEDNTAAPNNLYKYYIQARDESGATSAPSEPVKGRLATHDAGILVVDGTKDGNDMVLRPSDEKVDEYYASLLNSFDYNGQLDLSGNSETANNLSDADLSIYSTVIWHSDVSPGGTSLADDTTAIKKYLNNGGKLVLTGWSLFENLLANNPSNTFFAPGNFAYDYLQTIHVLKSSGADQDFKGADAQIAEYPDIQVDAAKVPVFDNNLIAMEVFDTLVEDDDLEVLYTYRSSAEPVSQYHGEPVAIRHLSDSLKLAVVNFPLYFMNENEAAQLIEQLLLDFGEEKVTGVADNDDETSQPAQFHLSQNYPNPFNATTHIRFSLPEEMNAKVILYNMQGKYVKTLFDQKASAGTHSVTLHADELSSGIYLYKLVTEKYTAAKKLVYLK